MILRLAHRVLLGTLVVYFLVTCQSASAFTCAELFRLQPGALLQSARNSEDSQLSRGFTTAAKIISALNSGKDTYSMELMVNTPRFQAFLKSKGIADPLQRPREEQHSLLAEYAHVVLSQYRDPAHLDKLRSDALERDLQLRGAGQMSVVEVSALNREQLLSTLKVPDTPQTREAQRVLDEVELYFTHNTNIPLKNRSLETPLLSSRQLEQAGFGHGLNSSYIFNRKVLQTDDHVFFFTHYKRKGSLAPTNATKEFGKQTLLLDSDYAMKHGWMSFFIMYAPSFINFLKMYRPDLIEKLSDKIESHSGIKLYNERLSEQVTRDNVWHSFLKYEPEFVAEMLGSLHKRDFTLADFQEVWRAQALNSLYHIHSSNPTEFSQLLQQLKSDNNSVQRVMHKLVDTALGDPQHGFEMKIPVAVDHTVLQAH